MKIKDSKLQSLLHAVKSSAAIATKELVWEDILLDQSSTRTSAYSDEKNIFLCFKK